MNGQQSRDVSQVCENLDDYATRLCGRREEEA